MKKIIIIFFLLPLISFSQRGGTENFSGFGGKKKASYFRGSISGNIVDAKTGKGVLADPKSNREPYCAYFFTNFRYLIEYLSNFG